MKGIGIGIFTHPNCLLHDMGVNHPECPARIRVIDKALHDSPFYPLLRFYQAQPATDKQILKAHSPEYLNWLKTQAPKEAEQINYLDADTIMNPYTLSAAYLAAGAVVQAIDLVMQHEIKQAFCNIRPPGHHAEHAKAMGFCFLNNIAIGAMHLLEHYQLKRVAIIDFDVHQGNGTEDIFKNDNRILFCSSFQYPFYPHTPLREEPGHLLPIPLIQGSVGGLFRKQVEEMWLPALKKFEPEFILISAGFDAYKEDPLANLNFSEKDYYWITNEVQKIANIYCEGKVVSSLEGGYNLSALGRCAVEHVRAYVES